jgi:exodeoxyribonuclease-3
MSVFCASIYHLARPALASGARQPAIYKDTRFSDHAPISIEYDWGL